MSDQKVRNGRTFVTFLCCVLAVPTCAHLMPGVQAPDLTQAVAAGALLGACYLILRPILRLVTLPLGCLTLGLFNVAIDVGLILACSHLIEGFSVDTPLTALLISLFVNAMIAITGGFR